MTYKLAANSTGLRAFVIPLVMAVALADALLGCSGCIVLLPPMPRNVWGYGQVYELVDESGEPVKSGGRLLLRSPYTYDDKNELIRCFPVRETGCADVSKTAEPRFEAGPLGLMCEQWGTVLPLGFYAMWCNPRWTEVYPLLPGYVPADWPERAGPVVVDESRPPPRVIHLMHASPAVERQYLEKCTKSRGAETGQNKSALELAQQYALGRCRELEVRPR
jgi:hypothetical protein